MAKITYTGDDLAHAIVGDMKPIIRKVLTERVRAVVTEELGVLVEKYVNEVITKVASYRRLPGDTFEVTVNVELKEATA